MLITLDEAVELVERLSRTKNYPRDGAGVTHLAEGLMNAAAQVGVSAPAIVARCSAVSEWCPTDVDMLRVACDLRDSARANGPTQPLVATRKTKCKTCGDSGWREIWTLHTSEGAGEYSYVRKQNLPVARALELRDKLGTNQKLYSGVRRCNCQPKPAEKPDAE